MKKFFKYRAGETLVEVMVAVSMLALVVTPAASMYITSLRTTAANRAELIAFSLAEEGVEMMRNFRDTNLLRFPQKKVQCWDTVPAHTTQINCENNKIIADAYVLHLDLQTFEWGLLPQNQVRLSQHLNASSDANYQLYLDDMPGSPCTNQNLSAPPPNEPGCHLHFVTDTHLYSSNNPRGVPTEFYREIFVQYFDIYGRQGSDVMEITSTVHYRVGAGVRTYVYKAILRRPTSNL